MDKLYSVHFADSINLRQLKSEMKFNLLADSNIELFYSMNDDKYMAIYHYGAIAFINFSESERKAAMEIIETKSTNIEKQDVAEEISIEFIDGESSFSNNILRINSNIKSKESVYRIVMFDVSQSVALDYYLKIGQGLLDKVNKYSKELEEKGDLNLSRKEIMKFIGKSLNTKNNIVDTLYVFDSPDITWENEDLDKLHHFLVGVFDLSSRHKEIDSMFKVIDDNLDIFSDLMQHKSSHNMELIVIILITIEILNIVLERLHVFN